MDHSHQEYKYNLNTFKYIKGSCFWFAKNNWTDTYLSGEKRTLRKCRDGSLCRFIHLTGKECQDLNNNWNALTNCPSCVYKSSPFPEGLEGHELIQEKIRREMPCQVDCRNGKVLKRKLTISNSRKRNWCDCDRETKTKYGVNRYDGYSHPLGERDAWVCNYCKCICQIG